MPNVAKPNSIPTVRKINIKYNWREEWKSLFGRYCSVSLTMKKSYLREDYWIFFLHLDDNWSSAIDNLARQNSPGEGKKLLDLGTCYQVQIYVPGWGRHFINHHRPGLYLVRHSACNNPPAIYGSLRCLYGLLLRWSDVLVFRGISTNIVLHESII